jgi:hypothetical protein
MIRIIIFITETHVPCFSGLWNFMIVSLFINLVFWFKGKLFIVVYIFNCENLSIVL